MKPVPPITTTRMVGASRQIWLARLHEHHHPKHLQQRPRYYLTDTIYSDLSTYADGWGAYHELVPELAVGRLVETPTRSPAW